MRQKILITGGAGYIGSHILSLIGIDNDVLIFDNLSNSSKDSLAKLESLIGNRVFVAYGDIKDYKNILNVMSEFSPDIVIHLAGSKTVLEGFLDGDRFWENNYSITLSLLRCIIATGCQRLVFASAMAVYGQSRLLPFNENSKPAPIEPMGEIKLACEEIIEYYSTKFNLDTTILRLGNVIGAHPSGKIGEYLDYSNKLLPSIFKSINNDEPFTLFSPNSNYTSERDYIHVMDVAKAIELIINIPFKPSYIVYNLSAGNKFSSFKIAQMVQKATGKVLDIQYLKPKYIEAPTITINNQLISESIAWRPEYSIDQAIEDQWRWLKGG
jgi:UDP-glucose 4-epimerase